jgi:hypothetical protein
MMLDFSRIQPLLTDALAANSQVILAYLFGSQARGTANVHSDVDVAMLLSGQPDENTCFDVRMAIMDDVMGALRVNDVDVAILNRAPLALQYRVLRDGKLLFCRDHNQRIAYQLKVVNAYLDFKPILERHEQAILAKARQGELLHGYNPHRGALEHYRAMRERLEAASNIVV